MILSINISIRDDQYNEIADAATSVTADCIRPEDILGPVALAARNAAERLAKRNAEQAAEPPCPTATGIGENTGMTTAAKPASVVDDQPPL